MKLSLNTTTFLLASTMAFSSPSMTAANKEGHHGPRGTRTVSAPSLRSPRFLSEDDPASPDQQEGGSGKSDTGGSSDGSSSDGGSLQQRSFQGAPTKRECEMSYEDDEAEFECKAETETEAGSIEDKIKFKIKAKKEKSLKVTVEYESEIDTEDVESETETQYTLVFDRLLEYRKAGDSIAVSRSNPGARRAEGENEAFVWGEDEVVAEWYMEEWSDFSPLQTDGKMMRFSASTLAELATFRFTIHESGDGMDITANRMKIDFTLEGYPWSNSGDTYVALVCHIETEREVEIESENDDEDQAMDVLISFDDAVDAIGFTPFGMYTWADFAEVRMFTDDNSTAMDGGNMTRYLQEEATNIPVVATTSPRTSAEADPTTTFNEIAFSFVGAGRGASQIYWDPEAGIGYAEDGTTDGSSAMPKTTVASSFWVIASISAALVSLMM